MANLPVERIENLMAANLPPQLVGLLGASPVTTDLSRLLEAAPGYAWTPTLMKELFEQYVFSNSYWRLETEMEKFPKVTVVFVNTVQSHGTGKRRTTETRITVVIRCYSGVDEPYGEGVSYGEQYYPFTPHGLKEAIEGTRQRIAGLKRRSFCSICLVREPPAKRFKMSDDVADVCGLCFVRRTIF